MKDNNLIYKRRSSLFIICFFLSIITFSQDERKIALVIGNANYEDPNAVLKNPVNDAQLMSETFKELKFDSIIIANNLNYNEMRKAFSINNIY
tara:strand:- start:448 stop:726 length:279 start_codon:yes stop_codon:yes gene_type:complete